MSVVFSSYRLIRSALEISDLMLAERLSKVRPLILSDGEHFLFDLPDPRNTAFTWAPVNVRPAKKHRAVSKFRTLHSCGFYGFFKPSIAEVLAQLPDDTRISAFCLDVSTIEILFDGEGHSCVCHWLAEAKTTEPTP